MGMKLKTVKPRIAMAGSRLAAAPTPSAKRVTGRRLQDRRLRIWSVNPHCAHCGVLTVYPNGFELDHRVPLHCGGSDTDDNCQVLCVEVDAQGKKAGCHELKTRIDLGYPNRP